MVSTSAGRFGMARSDGHGAAPSGLRWCPLMDEARSYEPRGVRQPASAGRRGSGGARLRPLARSDVIDAPASDRRRSELSRPHARRPRFDHQRVIAVIGPKGHTTRVRPRQRPITRDALAGDPRQRPTRNSTPSAAPMPTQHATALHTIDGARPMIDSTSGEGACTGSGQGSGSRSHRPAQIRRPHRRVQGMSIQVEYCAATSQGPCPHRCLDRRAARCSAASTSGGSADQVLPSRVSGIGIESHEVPVEHLPAGVWNVDLSRRANRFDDSSVDGMHIGRRLSPPQKLRFRSPPNWSRL